MYTLYFCQTLQSHILSFNDVVLWVVDQFIDIKENAVEIMRPNGLSSAHNHKRNEP